MSLCAVPLEVHWVDYMRFPQSYAVFVMRFVRNLYEMIIQLVSNIGIFA